MLSIFLNSVVIGFSGAMMPGSLLTYTIDRSLKSGARSGLMISLGHAFLELMVVFLIILGAGTFLASNAAQIVIGFIGGLFLVFLGAGMLKDVITKKINKAFDKISEAQSNLTEAGDPAMGGSSIGETSAADGASAQKVTDKGRMMVGGAVISASNPYFLFWWAVVGLGLILSAYRAFGIAGVAVFYTGHILTDITWYCFISLLISKTRRFINIKVYAIVIAILGICLMGFGTGFIANSFSLLRK